jgi:hypothetical protein
MNHSLHKNITPPDESWEEIVYKEVSVISRVITTFLILGIIAFLLLYLSRVNPVTNSGLRHAQYLFFGICLFLLGWLYSGAVWLLDIIRGATNCTGKIQRITRRSYNRFFSVYIYLDNGMEFILPKQLGHMVMDTTTPEGIPTSDKETKRHLRQSFFTGVEPIPNSKLLQTGCQVFITFFPVSKQIVKIYKKKDNV